MAHRRRLFIIGGIVAVVLVLAALAWFMIGSLRDSASLRTDEGTGALPGSEATEREGEGDLSPTPDSIAPTAGSPAMAQRVAVIIRYQRNPQFSLTIEEATLSSARVTIDNYQPASGAPFSVLRILDEAGQTLAQEPFTIPTGGILEGPNFKAEVIAADDGTSLLVVPLANSDKPVTVQLLSSSGQVLQEQPVTEAGTTQELKQPLSVWQRMKQRISNVFPGIARAQQEQGPAFTIAIINELGAEAALDGVVAVTNRMKNSIKPWSEFSDRVKVVAITNSVYLGCDLGLGNPSSCRNDALVAQLVTQQVPDWSTIIVVAPMKCDCGYVGTSFPPVLVVGSNASVQLIVHELGHSVAKMVDEYGYLQGGFVLIPGAPNCFDTTALCQTALAPFRGQSGGQCSLGCDGVTRWRPATRIMHNTYSPLEFGPLERCLLGEKIAEAIGEEYDCGKDDEPQESPTPSPSPGDYWGWYR